MKSLNVSTENGLEISRDQLLHFIGEETENKQINCSDMDTQPREGPVTTRTQLFYSLFLSTILHYMYIYIYTLYIYFYMV